MTQLRLLFPKQLINVVTKDGQGALEIEADIFGQYAVHETPVVNDISETWWTVTHVLSGLAIMHFIHDYLAACDLARRIDDHVDGDAYWHNGRCANQEFFNHLNEVVHHWRDHHGINWPYRFSGNICG